MKKAIRNIVIGATCATVIFAMTGCNPDPEHFDAETRPVAIAIGAPDQNFNPFFYTSGNDGEIIGLTQISMLTADANGKIVCGEDQATMALDYSVTSYDKNNQVATGTNIDHTTYEFIIKNGVKDSMGYDMGILDVLFNLYVYLDPMYTGSSTIYSTNIKGLKAYRAQQEIDDGSSIDPEDQYRAAAQQRLSNIIAYDTPGSTISWDSVKDDVQLVAKKFKESLEKDWNSVVGTVSSYTEYRFTEDWEVYLWNEGLLDYQYQYNDLNNKERIKDENGKFYTTIDKPVDVAKPAPNGGDMSGLRTRVMEPALEGKTGTERAEAMKKAAIGIVFDTYFMESLTEEGIYEGNSGMLSALLGSSVSADILNAFIRDEMSNGSSSSDGELKIKSISGITTDKVKEVNGVIKSVEADKEFKGTMNANLKGEEHDLLRITIDKVDPAAIYNFAFTVAPMHYYSGTFKDKDYVKFAQENWKNPNASNRFGVCFMNSDFMDGIVGGQSVEGGKKVPVGAGAYKMSESASQFYDGSMARYQRNEYFTTLGSGIENAKIKYLNYVYTTDDQILNSLTNKDIDYGEPNCTPRNIEQISPVDHLNMRNYPANGFGYVGINPTYVPDREVRVAIMLALNPQNYIVNNYYTTQYSEPIFRPTSKTNFLSDNDRDGYLSKAYEFKTGDVYGVTQSPMLSGLKLEWTDQSRKITDLVESAGWTKPTANGKYEKGGKTLSLTFTIAGEDQNHPARQMFDEAAKQLNQLGFDITVKNDLNVLISLATGKLAVWAAAWSTGIDPDMYQIYHKDSNASSTRNWGYATIMSNTSLYPEENAILTHLSNEIDLARSFTQESYRSEHYINALNDVMELAVELPTYQRHDLGVYNNKVIKFESLNQNPSANAGLLFKIWELDYN